MAPSASSSTERSITDIELREELIALGHAFRTSSDTEVLIEAYRAWGLDRSDVSVACSRSDYGMRGPNTCPGARPVRQEAAVHSREIRSSVRIGNRATP